MNTELSLLPERVRANEVNLITLSDGRELAFMEWGDRSGYPVFYFHGTPSCRLEGALADHAAKRLGFRLIATDRPGFGRSTFLKKRTFRDWPKDVLELADTLEIGEFGVAGHSGGGPHLFVCGALIDPGRLKFIGALGPWAPVASPEIMQSLNALDRAFARVSHHMPWIMHAAFAPIGWSARHWQGMFFRLMQSSVSPADKHMMDDERFIRHFKAMELEAFRQGSRGGAHEAFIAYRDWGFDIADIKVPTHIWLGAEDIFVPNAMGEYMRRTIPGVDLHFAPGKGHFNIENWDDILAACKADI